jgi:putative PEP-CTERM system histidine kinase
MHLVVIVSYLSAAIAFLVGTLLLALSWRGQRIGAWLILAMAVSVLWAVFLAYAEWRGTIDATGILDGEILRYGAWLAFVTALFRDWPERSPFRAFRIVVHGLWILLLLYCLWGTAGLAHSRALPFTIGVPLVGVLVLAVLGLVFLEQLYRNVQPDQRWALKFLVIGLGVLFAYDVFLYSYAALYGRFNISTWAARGIINALLVPLFMVAAARNANWSLPVAVSRRVVFYSTGLLAIAFYVIATAIGGYYVRIYGGNWGQVAEITLMFLAALVLLVIGFSGEARSRLRLFLYKNFFSFRHDYREEWLRLTAKLAAGDGELSERATRALAQIMDSPAGALFMRGEGPEFAPAASFNMTLPSTLRLRADEPLFEFMRKHLWIYDFSAQLPAGEERLTVPAELTTLPRAWLLVPLVIDGRLIGLVLLAQARARRRLDWEDIDLLRAAGSQVASTLAQADNARRLAESRQFEGFNRLTAFMMHDLKNLAAQQSLLLQNADRHRNNPAFVDDMITTVASAVSRTTRLLAQLRGESVAAPRNRVQISAVMEQALTACASQPPKPEYRNAPAELWVLADSEQLASIIGHVIRNAQDAAGAEGHVTVCVRRVAHQAVIEVADDGVGMDEEFLRHRLFQPFFTTKASKGMGIGAYQTREYVQSLGGAVRVQSAPKRGTVFTIELPLDLSAHPMATGEPRTA